MSGSYICRWCLSSLPISGKKKSAALISTSTVCFTSCLLQYKLYWIERIMLGFCINKCWGDAQLLITDLYNVQFSQSVTICFLTLLFLL